MKTASLSLILSAALLAADAAFADQAEFCIQMSLHDAASEEQLADASCQVLQALTWGDFSSLWKCRFGGQDRKVVATTAQMMGYDYERQAAHVTYSVDPGTVLGKFLLPNMGLATSIRGAAFKIFFQAEPVTADKRTVVHGVSGAIYELHINRLNYGACRQPQ